MIGMYQKSQGPTGEETPKRWRVARAPVLEKNHEERRQKRVFLFRKRDKIGEKGVGKGVSEEQRKLLRRFIGGKESGRKEKGGYKLESWDVIS